MHLMELPKGPSDLDQLCYFNFVSSWLQIVRKQTVTSVHGSSEFECLMREYLSSLQFLVVCYGNGRCWADI
jgi:hypothetical protein